MDVRSLPRPATVPQPDSSQYNTHYVTVITQDNRQVFFAYRERIEPGANIRICGRVKRHADRATQLSRVKISQQEEV